MICELASTLGDAGSVAAIVGAAVAVVLLLAGVIRSYRRREEQSKFSGLLHEGNELSVRLNRTWESQVQEWKTMTSELDRWWGSVETQAESSRPDLLPVLRSGADMPGLVYANHNDEYAWRRNWLTQRLGQLEKVLGQP